ncbi:MAG: NAD(P)-dependent oxidoreductase [Deltaproteobacteria bacterium]|nr:NAD(P)-dependent oxidoreductase [Deltaproteobacteria bacterium]
MAEPPKSRRGETLLLTGVASFTGSHIARACRVGGFRVIGALTRGFDEYATPLLRQRIAYSGVQDWIERAPFGSQRLLDAIRGTGVEIFVHHGANLQGYRDQNFDVQECVRTNCENARQVFEALRIGGCRRFMYSGTFFEPDGPRPAVSSYGVGKAGIWEEYRKGAATVGLATTKIFIPNPIGPLENEDRLMPSFVKVWKQGGKPVLRTPHLLRDNLPVPWLADRYLQEACRLGGENERYVRPSGYVMSNLAFVATFLGWVERVTGRVYEVQVEPIETAEPKVRHNTEPCPQLTDPEAEIAFWSSWIRSLEI